MKKIILPLFLSLFSCLFVFAQGQSKFNVFYQKALNGDADAQYYVGCCYERGDGVVQDYAKAVEWFTKAANQGDASAQNNLGVCYKRGEGVPQNYSKAVEWYTKSANQGNVNAQYNLGLCYQSGSGIPQNYTKAVDWFTKAARQGDADAYFELAYCYAEAKGVNKDLRKALELISSAIRLEPDNTEFQDLKRKIQAMGESSNGVYYSQSDVDYDIPKSATVNSNTIAIVIANENYRKESTVEYALNDGKIFSEYCHNTLGIPESNIHHIENATLNDMIYEVDWAGKVMDAYKGKLKVIFYYSGHGIPDEKDKSAYLLPVDGYGTNVSTGYALEKLFANLSQHPNESVTVFLDACFSGSTRNNEMIEGTRGIAIKVKNSVPQGNLIIFSASQGDETAYPFEEQQHGLFTYCLLQKIKETKGDVTYGELSEYVRETVSQRSILFNGKSQIPTITTSQEMADRWMGLKLR